MRSTPTPDGEAAPTQPRTPRYVGVADALEDEIRKLAPNSLLATEEQLARRFQVSRVTIRSALDLLENSGLVSRLRGRGTVVSPAKVTRTFAPLSSFEQDMAVQGVAFDTQVLGFTEAVDPPEDIRRRLALSPEDSAGCLSLVRLVDDRVVCHEMRYYPPDLAARVVPGRAENEDCSDIIEDIAGEPIADVHWESEILPASAPIAAALGVASRTLVLTNAYTWLIRNGRAAEAGIISYRVDRCKFRFDETFQKPARNRPGA